MPTLFGAKLGVVAAVLMVCLVSLAIISRNWSCRKRRERPPRPPVAYDVTEVETGASLLVSRGRRQFEVSLWGVAAPTETHPCYAAARANLKELAGEWIRVEEKGAIHPAAKCECSGGKCDLSRRHVVIVGIAYGQSGQCLQIEQLRGGYCLCLDGMPAEWRAAEAEARIKKAGIWQASE